eukprot:986402-Heterocapsa_arctica.AAC.1
MFLPPGCSSGFLPVQVTYFPAVSSSSWGWSSPRCLAAHQGPCGLWPPFSRPLPWRVGWQVAR